MEIRMYFESPPDMSDDLWHKFVCDSGEFFEVWLNTWLKFDEPLNLGVSVKPVSYKGEVYEL